MVVCPFCEKEFSAEEIIMERIKTGSYVYSCPCCKKLLEIQLYSGN